MVYSPAFAKLMDNGQLLISDQQIPGDHFKLKRIGADLSEKLHYKRYNFTAERRMRDEWD